MNDLLILLYLFPDQYWDWGDLSANPDITWKIIQENLNKSWSWYRLSENPNITWKIVQENPNKPWNWYRIISKS